MALKLFDSKCTLYKTYQIYNKWFISTKPEAVNYSEALTTIADQQRPLIDDLRSLPCKSPQQKLLKNRVWAIAPSSIQVGGRGIQYHREHTGFISFDLDDLGTELAEIFRLVKQIPYVCYCSRSASGNGLWGHMQISNPKKHKEHFDAMSASFLASIGKKIDPAPSSVASLRFLCCDPDAYINNDAPVFTKILEPEQPKKIQLPSVGGVFNKADDVWANFRTNAEHEIIHNILLNSGWSYHSTKGQKVRYTRPGKDSRAGISSDYHTDRKTLFIWSSEAPGLEHFKPISNGWAGSAATVLLAYECNGDKKLAYQKMKELGF